MQHDYVTVGSSAYLHVRKPLRADWTNNLESLLRYQNLYICKLGLQVLRIISFFVFQSRPLSFVLPKLQLCLLYYLERAYYKYNFELTEQLTKLDLKLVPGWWNNLVIEFNFCISIEVPFFKYFFFLFTQNFLLSSLKFHFFTRITKSSQKNF